MRKTVRCLLIGADSVGGKKSYLKEKLGVKEVLHWDGRGKKMPPLSSVCAVVVLTGFIGHEAVKRVKREAERKNIEVLYLKRGVSELEAPA